MWTFWMFSVLFLVFVVVVQLQFLFCPCKVMHLKLL